MRRCSLVVLVVIGILIGHGCSSGSSEAPESPASVDEPQVLTDEQAQSLALMTFKNHAVGVSAFEGRLLGGDNGDLIIAGWLDFAHRRGVAKASPPGEASVLIVWSTRAIAYLDVAGGTAPEAAPTLPLPDGAWRRVRFDPEATELTRLLGALLLLSDDRPQNPLLVRQNGARYLGTDTVDGIDAHRFSGPTAHGDPGSVDLGTQYWLDGAGRLIRFGFRADASGLSMIDFHEAADAPATLPRPDAVAPTVNG